MQFRVNRFARWFVAFGFFFVGLSFFCYQKICPEPTRNELILTTGYCWGLFKRAQVVKLSDVECYSIRYYVPGQGQTIAQSPARYGIAPDSKAFPRLSGGAKGGGNPRSYLYVQLKSDADIAIYLNVERIIWCVDSKGKQTCTDMAIWTGCAYVLDSFAERAKRNLLTQREVVTFPWMFFCLCFAFVCFLLSRADFTPKNEVTPPY